MTAYQNKNKILIERPVIAAAALFASGSALAVVSGFTETYDGGAYSVEAPTLNTDDDGAPTLTLTGDALVASNLSGGRSAILLEITDAVPTPGLIVTQSVDFSVPTGTASIDNVSRLGFLFGVTAPETSTLGPSDGLYVFLKEPSGDFAPPRVDADWFDADAGFVSDNADDTENAAPELVGDTLYSMASSAAYQADGSIDITLEVTQGDSTLLDYAYSLPGLDGVSLDGAYYGLYFRNFADDAEIIFDNYSVTAVPEPASLALLSLGMVAFGRRRRA